MIKVHSDWELRGPGDCQSRERDRLQAPVVFHRILGDLQDHRGMGIRRPGSQRFGKFDLNDVEGASAPARLGCGVHNCVR